MQLKVSGKGNASPGNGISGDLIVLIEEITHENLFMKEIICTMIYIFPFLKRL